MGTRVSTAALFSDDGTRVFSAGDDGVIRAWSVANGKEAREPLVFGAVVYGLASIPNSNRIVAVGDGESPVETGMIPGDCSISPSCRVRRQCAPLL